MTTSTGLTGLVVGSVGRGVVGRGGCSRFLPNSQYSLEIGAWAGSLGLCVRVWGPGLLP